MDADSRDTGTAADGMRRALELFDLGLEIQRNNLRRAFPGAPDDDIERRLAEWLLERRGAEHGDAEGRVCHRDFGVR